MFSAGVPAELGGGGASHADLVAMLRVLGQSCGSTALALAMHTHQVAIAAWRWRHDGAAVEPLLRRVAAEELIIATSGGSDWLSGSGRADKVEGGYRVSGRKVFASGSPAADLFSTMAIYDDPEAGPTVLHFAIPFTAPGLAIADNWRALGMRGTGSNDVALDGVFVPEAAVSARRPAGRWSPLWHVVAALALPLIYAVYVGIAEAARALALRAAVARRHDAGTQRLVGAMDTELATARMALRQMVDTAASGHTGLETTNEVMIGRTVAGPAAIRTVELAMEVAGGGGFFREAGLERLFRDVQGARYHPLRADAQHLYAGRLALGLDVNG
jgi:acyl-CoA dehydrogenase